MKTIDPVDQSVREEYVAWMKETFAQVVANSDPAKCKLHPQGKFVLVSREERNGVWMVTTPEGQKVLFVTWQNAWNFVENGIQLRFNEWQYTKLEEMWR